MSSEKLHRVGNELSIQFNAIENAIEAIDDTEAHSTPAIDKAEPRNAVKSTARTV